jgi:hypothetical protein
MEGSRVQEGERGLAGMDGRGLMTAAFGRGDHEGGEFGVILDDQQSRHGG